MEAAKDTGGMIENWEFIISEYELVRKGPLAARMTVWGFIDNYGKERGVKVCNVDHWETSKDWSGDLLVKCTVVTEPNEEGAIIEGYAVERKRTQALLA